MSKRLQNLYYFTDSFPYGLGERWKYNDLATLKGFADQVTVVPLTYGGKYERQSEVPDGIIVEEPLFDNYGLVSRLTPRIFANGAIDRLLRNHVLDISYTRKCGGIRRVFRSYVKSQNILRKISKRHILAIDPRSCSLFFFWGIGSAEIIPWLPHGFTRIVVGYHGFDLYEDRHGGKSFPFRPTQLERVSLAAPCSGHGQNHLSRANPKFKYKIVRRCLGVEDAGVSFPSNDGRLRIVSCARIHPIKRLDVIVDALSQCGFPIEWTHIGGGSGLEELSRRSREKKTANVGVSFLGDVCAADVRKYYREHPVDILISTSKSEGLPVSIMEALSAGIPIIATDVGGVSEVVDPSVGILLSENASAVEVANALARFSKLTALETGLLRKNARSRFETEFRVPQVIESFAQIAFWGK